MSWSSVALYTLTGTLTSPKEIEPFQMERIESVCPYGHADTRLTTMRQLSAGYMPRFDTSGPLHFDRPAGTARATAVQLSRCAAASSAARFGRSAPARATVSADDRLAASS